MHAETNLHPTIAQAIAAFAPPQSEVHRIAAIACSCGQPSQCDYPHCMDSEVHREPVTRFNDDDLYEFDAHTFELFRQHSPQRADLQHLMRGAPSGVAMLHDGHSLARGAKVKHLGLWQRRKFDDVPAFLMRGEA